jgi:death on curing protein
MRYLSLQEVSSLHSLLIAQSGGSSGLRDRAALESALAQPEASFGVEELFQISPAKLASAHSLIQNHSFVDGTSVPVTPRWKSLSYLTDTKLTRQLMSRRR